MRASLGGGVQRPGGRKTHAPSTFRVLRRSTLAPRVGPGGGRAGGSAGESRGQERREAQEPLRRPEAPRHRPGADVGAHRRHRDRPADPNTWYVAVGSGGVWKTTNAGTTWTPIFDGQALVLDRLRRRSTRRTRRRLGRHRREHRRPARRLRRRRLPSRSTAARRGRTSASRIRSTSRKIVVAPARLEHRLGRRARTAVVAGRRPRPVQDDRRRQDLEEGAGRRRLDRRHRPARRPAQPRRALRRDLAEPAHRRRLHRRRARVGHPQIDRRRQDLDEARQAACPKADLGKIGLAISPQNPDVVYAAIELDRRDGRLWRSTDRGASWEKRSDPFRRRPARTTTRSSSPSPHALRPRLPRRRPDPGLRRRRQDVPPPRASRTNTRQPRDLFPPRRPRLPAGRLRRRHLRDVRPGARPGASSRTCR